VEILYTELWIQDNLNCLCAMYKAAPLLFINRAPLKFVQERRSLIHISYFRNKVAILRHFLFLPCSPYCL